MVPVLGQNRQASDQMNKASDVSIVGTLQWYFAAGTVYVSLTWHRFMIRNA